LDWLGWVGLRTCTCERKVMRAQNKNKQRSTSEHVIDLKAKRGGDGVCASGGDGGCGRAAGMRVSERTNERPRECFTDSSTNKCPYKCQGTCHARGAQRRKPTNSARLCTTLCCSSDRGPRTSRSRLCMKQTHETRGTNCKSDPQHAHHACKQMPRARWECVYVWVVSQERWVRGARGMEAVASEL
jgi:hypothetical protein